MAPTPRPAIHRRAVLIHAAVYAAKHLLIAVAVDRLAVLAHVSVTARVLLTLVVIVGAWQVRKRRA
jgi:hypothetical protein